MGLGTFSFFSALLAVVPIAAFFAVKAGRFDTVLVAVLGEDNVTDSGRLVASGVIGVICVQVLVGLFLITAWREAPPPPPSRSKKE